MARRILIVDDEQDILDLLKYNLEAEGYETATASDGLQALERAKNHPDLIILDVMLPGKDGWEVMRQLRQSPGTQKIPVIFLTAKASEIDEVVGLELGADDYITKPISMRKLLARVKMVLRKTRSTESKMEEEVLRFGEVEINTSKYSVTVCGAPAAFTKKEFELLVYLARRPGRVVTRDTLLTEIWGDNVVVIDRTIDVHIRKIREKLGDDNMQYIETIKGVGYRLKAAE